MYSSYVTNGMFAGFAGNCLKSEDGWRMQKSTCLGCDQAEKPWISDLFDIYFCHVASKRASWGFAGMVCKTEWVMMSGCIVSAFCPGIHATNLLCYASHMSCLCEVRTWFFLSLCAGFRATCSSQGSISISFTAPHWRCTSRRKRATPSILWDFWPSARASGVFDGLSKTSGVWVNSEDSSGGRGSRGVWMCVEKEVRGWSGHYRPAAIIFWFQIFQKISGASMSRSCFTSLSWLEPSHHGDFLLMVCNWRGLHWKVSGCSVKVYVCFKGNMWSSRTSRSAVHNSWNWVLYKLKRST